MSDSKYEYRYFIGGDDSQAVGANGMKLMEILDAELADLKERKDEFWTSVVEMLVETNVMNQTIPESVAKANARFCARFTSAIVKDKWGEAASKDKMSELIADAGKIVDKLVLAITGASVVKH